ncbi:MAG: serine/threonine-protein kinase [Pseudomonadota bacterium]
MISKLGRYSIIEELGQGAMGNVYKALDPLIDRIVAIKTFNLNQNWDQDQHDREEYEARFYQEAKTAGRLSHVNIVTVYDVGKSENVAYMAMEFLQGRELRDILKTGQSMPLVQVLEIAEQVARGLSFAHENGVVHRDIKPSNIMVLDDGRVKITDFGIARIASSPVHTQAGMTLGSPQYMSPEQVQAQAIDQRSDIFSLGVVMYEMLTGQPPFTGEHVNAIMYQIMHAMPAPPSDFNPDVPKLLDAIVLKALAKKPGERHREARELAQDLSAETAAHRRVLRSAGENSAEGTAESLGMSAHINSDRSEMNFASATSESDLANDDPVVAQSRSFLLLGIILVALFGLLLAITI